MHTLLPLLLPLLPLTLSLPTNHLHTLLPRQNSTAAANPNTPVPVARAGTTLNPSAAAEANPPDLTATLAFSSTSIKDSTGNCLSVDPLAGDFRQNLIPVTVGACKGGEGEKWDVVSKGVHLADQGAVLVVSSLVSCCCFSCGW